MGEKSKDWKLREFVNRIRIMERYHWDYITYLKQPAFVIENIKRYLSVESEYQEKNGTK